MISAPRGTRRPRSATMQSLRSRIMRFGVGNMALLMLTLDPHTADVVRSAGPFAGSWSPPIAISHQSLRVRFIFPEPPVKRCSRDPKAAGRRADIMSVLFKRLPDQDAHNISAAARSLGIARTTLYRRLRKDEPDTQ